MVKISRYVYKPLVSEQRVVQYCYRGLVQSLHIQASTSLSCRLSSQPSMARHTAAVLWGQSHTRSLKVCTTAREGHTGTKKGRQENKGQLVND